MDLLEHMSYEGLRNMRSLHSAWRLLAADNAPFIASFLYREFIYPNQRRLSEEYLINRLEQHMELVEHIRENQKRARDYLVEWSDDAVGWLRRFYPKNEDAIHYDLSSAAEKAIEWLVGLKPESFIGTESRLLMVFDLLDQIVSGTQEDPKQKILELERKKEDIEREISLVKKGEMRLLVPTQIRERFMQASSMAREILADFRAVEQNFRQLNRAMREKIARWDRSKGELVGDYFSEQDSIYQSDQGKSFDAFFHFIMSGEARSKFDHTIQELKKLSVLGEMIETSRIEDVASDWLEGSREVWSNVETMSEQLRRYVDESYIEEERRIKQLIKSIEIQALGVSEYMSKQTMFEIDEMKPEIQLVMDRNLFSPPRLVELVDEQITYGDSSDSTDALYSHIYVDSQKLYELVQTELHRKLEEYEAVYHQNGRLETEAGATDDVEDKIAAVKDAKVELRLGEVIEKHPIQYGLTELMSYFSLTSRIPYRTNDGESERITYRTPSGDEVCAKVPKLWFVSKEPRDASTHRPAKELERKAEQHPGQGWKALQPEGEEQNPRSIEGLSTAIIEDRGNHE